ncbi:katanin p60 ATPase-containing subunit A-like 1 [Platysternon megacephalum]|uniref:Arginine vasopressin-induced protein 1 n=1 Tax=Platysternon megacephalum TaxID=55544 RepID=A0A4D9ELR6_9SAUR|nr:katanin p60 ATPase-containing subunit A-like 1 [Platysternon megacephalum]
MGTPASVACDPLQCQVPEARARKRASANIFQDVGLLQLRSLFRSSGDERAEQRAQLVWEYAGDRRTAQALRQLRSRQRRRRQPPQLSPAAQDSSEPRYRLGTGPGMGSSTHMELRALSMRSSQHSLL